MLACRCGPRHQSNTFSVTDAVRAARFDPTGTLDIRNKFRREMDAAWSKLHRLVLEAVDRNDALGLRGVTATSIDLTSPFLGYDKVKSFQDWIDAALNQVVLVGGVWTSKYIKQTAGRAIERANELTGGDVVGALDRVRALESLTVVELQGVMEAVSQQAVRAFTEGMMAKQRPSQVARSVAAVINAIGKVRGRMVVNTMIVKTFTAVTADAFRSAGITRIGTVPERIRVVRGAKGNLQLAKDAARKTQQKRGKGGKFKAFRPKPTARQLAIILKREAKLQALGEVDVLNADDPCPICEEISASGPYSIDEAESLIPNHPNCLCSLIPVSDERFAEIEKE